MKAIIQKIKNFFTCKKEITRRIKRYEIQYYYCKDIYALKRLVDLAQDMPLGMIDTIASGIRNGFYWYTEEPMYVHNVKRLSKRTLMSLGLELPATVISFKIKGDYRTFYKLLDKHVSVTIEEEILL